MTKLLESVKKTVGLPPGTMIHVGEKKLEKPIITVFDYDLYQFQEKIVETVEESFPYKDKPTVTWINIDGIHDIESVRKIQDHFEIHPLVLEDIVNTSQRAKIDDYGDYIYIVLRMLQYKEESQEILSEQISMVLGKNFVISFQETIGDVFNPIRDRIRTGKGRVRRNAADYLAYVLIDSIVDHYFAILERLGERIEDLEDEIVNNDDPKIPHKIHSLKRDMVYLRKQIWPLRELISAIQRNESKLIQKTTLVYLRDVYDHVIQVVDTIELFKDLLSGLHDIYLSSISNRMNEVMKILTIFTSVFIPITFIASVFGMNFQYMPELHTPHGYYIALGVMTAVALSMLLYFKRKKWM